MTLTELVETADHELSYPYVTCTLEDAVVEYCLEHGMPAPCCTVAGIVRFVAGLRPHTPVVR